MKNKKNILTLHSIFFVIFFIASVNAYSQVSLNPDSLKTGVSYKFVLYNETEVIGKVTGTDSVYIHVSDDRGAYRLRKEDVFFISRDLVRSKFNIILSLGGGIGILNAFGENNYGYGYGYGNSDYKPKFSLQATGLIPLGDNKGIRLDIGYSRWKRGESIQPYYSGEGYYKYGEQSKDYYYLKGDFVYGSISPVNKFWIYGIAGFGIHVMKDGASFYESSHYNSYDSTYYFNHDEYPSYNRTSAVISLGAAFGYRFSKQLGVYADAQLNTLTYNGFFFLFWGEGGANYIPIRAGITYTIF